MLNNQFLNADALVGRCDLDKINARPNALQRQLNGFGLERYCLRFN